MLATLASAAAAPPLAPPGAADAPTLDLYVGDERRTTITTNFGTATEALDGVDRRRDEYREEHPAAAKRAVVLEAGLAHDLLFD